MTLTLANHITLLSHPQLLSPTSFHPIPHHTHTHTHSSIHQPLITVPHTYSATLFPTSISPPFIHSISVLGQLLPPFQSVSLPATSTTVHSIFQLGQLTLFSQPPHPPLTASLDNSHPLFGGFTFHPPHALFIASSNLVNTPSSHRAFKPPHPRSQNIYPWPTLNPLSKAFPSNPFPYHSIFTFCNSLLKASLILINSHHPLRGVFFQTPHSLFTAIFILGQLALFSQHLQPTLLRLTATPLLDNLPHSCCVYLPLTSPLIQAHPFCVN